MPTTRFRSVVLALFFVTFAGVFAVELASRKKKPVEPPKSPLVRVVEFTPVAEWETKSFPGVAKESQIANLSFRVSGKMVESNIVIGARIAKDGLVARLDPRDYELAVERLDKELQAAESQFSAMRTGARPEDVASLESQLASAKSALETTEANLNRFTALLADQVASQAQYDQAKTAYDAAKGQKETLENELEKAKTGARKEDIDAMQAKIQGLQASLNTAKNALDDTNLKAPFDGMIVEKFIEDHEVVSSGLPIVSFVDASVIDIAVSLPEEMIVRMDDIRNYHVEFESYPDLLYPATLKEIGRAIQRGRQSYPLQVRIDLSKADAVQKRPIFPGMTAMVHIDLKRQSTAQTVPLAALFGDGDAGGTNSAVWVVEDSKVVRRPVKLLRVVGTDAEVESDLKPHEKIVAAGSRSLREGQSVRLGE